MIIHPSGSSLSFLGVYTYILLCSLIGVYIYVHIVSVIPCAGVVDCAMFANGVNLRRVCSFQIIDVVCLLLRFSFRVVGGVIFASVLSGYWISA